MHVMLHILYVLNIMCGCDKPQPPYNKADASETEQGPLPGCRS